MQFVQEIMEKPWLETFSILFTAVALRYLAVAGIPYLLLYKFKLGNLRKIDAKIPEPRAVWAEIGWSLITSAIFAASGLVVLALWDKGWAVLLPVTNFWSILYLPINFILLVFLHETYFYFTHRWMHQPTIFRWVHAVHHRSRNPTPFAAFSFHPLEAIIEAAAIPLLLVLVPTSFFVLVAFLVFMTVLGVTNHLGYELYPRGTAEHRLGRWWIGAVHHYQHHRFVQGNYGLYVSCWDRWLGTQRVDYPEHFKRIKP